MNLKQKQVGRAPKYIWVKHNQGKYSIALWVE